MEDYTAVFFSPFSGDWKRVAFLAASIGAAERQAQTWSQYSCFDVVSVSRDL